MKQKQKKSLIKLFVEFIKLWLAGNILFWGTYGGYFVLHELAGWSDIPALATASIIAHGLFFVVNKEWVFEEKGNRRKTSDEIRRFIIFMGINYFINLGIVAGLNTYFGITPYIGQFVAAGFFTVWNFIGLRFWVFQETHHHAVTVPRPRRHDARRARRAA